ncbi:DinB family protein [Gorillibacterium sp. sgz500922]|uniref:DinB family protein n=1 Tax=Gorillibacterium sp. sgz500922 TaxID=3446694 RepID=UPI003F66F627
MFEVGTQWNPKQARLKAILQKREHFEEAVGLLSDMHSLVHESRVGGGQADTFMDEIAAGLDSETCRAMPAAKGNTIAWNLWHMTRIEDLTANRLVARREPVFDEEWMRRLGTDVKDTGNAMTKEEIRSFSESVSLTELLEYRCAVGTRTRTIIQGLHPEDMKRKVEKEQLGRIAEEGGVARREAAFWLLDFWGRKTVAGIFLMPITRHQIVHLNACRRIRESCLKQARR